MNLSLSLSLSYTHTVDGSVHVFCYAQRDSNDFQDDADLRNLIRLLSQGEKFVSMHAKNHVFEIVGGNCSQSDQTENYSSDYFERRICQIFGVYKTKKYFTAQKKPMHF